MDATNPSLTAPLEQAVNEIVGYITAALPSGLALLGIVLGVLLAVRVFRDLGARREGQMIAAHEASTSDIEMWQDNYLYVLGEGGSESEALEFADSQLGGFFGFSYEQYEAYLDRQMDKTEGM